ncbi:extracellular solute-binding protein [Frigidibacter sp.]|uniref:extracellular solute-binding protein n=1 Tax=Frigidibacter sp. TaxID=2586418 RepID=UPI0027330ABD|nr:extracellular solute-binding protein [Frigidibacter sp.]MDP3342228.1 extracellular solute-binding protein [Frigidibacter sp.]
MRIPLLATAFAGLLALPAAAKTEITVQFVPWMEGIFTEMKTAFEASHPDYEVTFLPPYADYDDGLQQVLRQSIGGQMPDITNQALNRQKTLISRGLAVDLTPFIAAEPNWAAEGFGGAMTDVASEGGKTYGLAVAFSSPVAYYNMDLVERAVGKIDTFPTTWPEMIALAAKIDALGEDISGLYTTADEDWIFQSLVSGSGGRMANEDGTEVMFDQEPGAQAFDIFASMLAEGGMPATSMNNAVQLFYAGKLGIFLQSINGLNRHTENIGGRFELRTGLFPRNATDGTLAPGGNVNMILTTDPERQKAAWAFVRFISSADGGEVLVKASGYMPPNALVAERMKAMYEANPNQALSLQQLPLLGEWYAFPGDNGLRIHAKITETLQALMNGQLTADEARTRAAKDVNALLK